VLCAFVGSFVCGRIAPNLIGERGDEDLFGEEEISNSFRGGTSFWDEELWILFRGGTDVFSGNFAAGVF